MKPTAIGWKVADLSEFTQVLAELLAGGVEQVHIGDVNGRYIASIVFREPLAWSIRIVKLMQRRTGSSDPLGLDHIDFTVDNLETTTAALGSAGMKFEVEGNDNHDWLSVRFGDNNAYEAKFVDHTVLDVCIQELSAANNSL